MSNNNIVTVVLILVIIIVLILVGAFIALNKEVFFAGEDTLSKEDFVQANVSETTEGENVQDVSDSTGGVENNNGETNVEESTEDPVLVQIVDRFNSCSATQEMRQLGYTMNATTQENRINVVSSGDGLYFNVIFVRNDNILSTEIRHNTVEPRSTLIKTLLGINLVDCVSQLKGYPERTLTLALNEEVASNYTLENEGVEIKSLDNNGIAIRIDLNSEFSFLNN